MYRLIALWIVFAECYLEISRLPVICLTFRIVLSNTVFILSRILGIHSCLVLCILYWPDGWESTNRLSGRSNFYGEEFFVGRVLLRRRIQGGNLCWMKLLVASLLMQPSNVFHIWLFEPQKSRFTYFRIIKNEVFAFFSSPRLWHKSRADLGTLWCQLSIDTWPELLIPAHGV